MAGKSSKGSGGDRPVSVRVKTGRGRKVSSTLWLHRQLNDPYVQRAKKEGYRSRAAYKLAELDDKFRFLKHGKSVVDLGAAPGGWTQIAVERCGKGTKVIGIDLKPVDPVEGAVLLVGAFMEEDTLKTLTETVGEKVDIVLSDMAPNASGHAATDHTRIIMLCEAAFDFAVDMLAPGGVFVAKVLKGGTENQLLTRMKKHFTTVKHAKPAASRSDSAEAYVIAIGFKG